VNQWTEKGRLALNSSAWASTQRQRKDDSFSPTSTPIAVSRKPFPALDHQNCRFSGLWIPGLTPVPELLGLQPHIENYTINLPGSTASDGLSREPSSLLNRQTHTLIPLVLSLWKTLTQQSFVFVVGSFEMMSFIFVPLAFST
jgi:hypothetical protein